MNYLLQLLGLEQSHDVANILDGDWQFSRSMPDGVIIALVVGGLALALINFLPQISMRLGVRIGTFLLRIAMLIVLLLVIGGLEWQVKLEVNEPQEWVVLVDDSASMATRDVDDKSRYDAALAELNQIKKASFLVNLSERTFSGNPVGNKPGQGPTLFRDAVSRAALSRSRPDRLVILTDGRDSERRDLRRLGEDLRSRDIKLTVRLFGSDSPPNHAGISAEPERNAIRLGEELIVRGAVSGNRGGDETVLFKENGKEVKRFTVAPKTDRRFEVRYKPPKKGQHTYTVELTGPKTVALNNAASFTVNVIEEKINVLLIEGFPRFEYKFVKLVLEVDPLVNLVSVAHLPGGGVHVQGEPLHRNAEQGLINSQADLFKYDVVILQDLPRSYFRAGGDTTESRLQRIVQFVLKRGGGLIVLGGQSVYRAGGYGDSALAEILPFDLSNQIGNEDQFEGLFYVNVPKAAYDHPILQLLPDPRENRERLNGLRQLDGSNNVGRFKPLATPLMTRSVKVKGKNDTLVEKETPILGYLAVGEGKVLGAAVDTLWRWQLQPDYADPPLAMLLANSVRFLAPPPGRKPGMPNVTINDGAPQVGQELLLATDLKDTNYDPIQGADLVVTVTPPGGQAYRMYPRDLPEEPGHYVYRVSLDQPGLYKVAAKYGKFESTREFLAGAATGEFADLSVDRKGADRLVKAAEGELSSGPVDNWLGAVDLKPARKAAVRDLQVWNSPLVLLLFLGLVCADCYIRKRQGLA